MADDAYDQLCKALDLNAEDARWIADWAADSRIPPVVFCRLVLLAATRRTHGLEEAMERAVSAAYEIEKGARPHCDNCGAWTDLALRCPRCLDTRAVPVARKA